MALREIPIVLCVRRFQVSWRVDALYPAARCLGMQADGFPCGTPSTSCEECRQMLDVLDDLAARVPVQD